MTNLHVSPEEAHLLASLIDLTSLKGNESSEDLMRLCNKAKALHVAGVCVYPEFISAVAITLEHTSIKPVCVEIGFPYPNMNLQERITACRRSIKEGAEEIDMVISYKELLAGNTELVKEEVQRFREATSSKTLKVILETGVLKSEASVKLAAKIAMDAGADFIKTSTGKTETGVTPAAVQWIAEEILDHYRMTGNKKGIKISGGITGISDSISYLRLIKEILGPDWINAKLFRIGTSKLADELLS